MSSVLAFMVCVSILLTSCGWMWLNDPYPELNEMVYHKEGGYYIFQDEKYWSRTTLLGYEDIVEIQLLGSIVTVGKKKAMHATWLTVGKSERDIEGNILVGGGIFIRDGFDYFKGENIRFDALCGYMQEKMAFEEIYIFEDGLSNEILLEKTDEQYRIESIALRIAGFDYVGCKADVYMIDNEVYLCNHIKTDYKLYKVSDEYQEIFKTAIEELNEMQS